MSAYHAHSHAQWLQGLMAHLPDIQWTTLTLPPRYFSWRLRGNSLSWAMLQREVLTGSYDVLLATSMTDLSALKGLVPELATLPSVVYFHENQFAYPRSAEQRQSVEPQILNLYTALSADVVLFNSDYNRQTFLEGAEKLLRKLPDYSPRSEVIQQLERSQVLPVGVDLPSKVPSRKEGGVLKLLWNHRWEYDKGPERLLALLVCCDQQGLELEISVVGQQFREVPAAFAEIKQRLANSVTLTMGHWGFVADAEDYQQLLSQSDVVLSTAIHDFQGLSVLEAVAAGCTPLVPNRLCYPEWFTAEFLYGEAGLTVASEAESAAQKLQVLIANKQHGALGAPDVSFLDWQCLSGAYASQLQAVLR